MSISGDLVHFLSYATLREALEYLHAAGRERIAVYDEGVLLELSIMRRRGDQILLNVINDLVKGEQGPKRM